MAGTKSPSIERLLRSAAAHANAQTSDALRRRDRDLLSLIQASNTAAGRTVLRFRIWKRYLSTCARAFVRAYAASARGFGAPDAFTPQHLLVLRWAIRSRTQKGIRELKQSIDTDYATAADGSWPPIAARYASLLAAVMAAADVQIDPLAADYELRLGQSAAENVAVPAQLEPDDSPEGRQARFQKFLIDHPMKEAEVARAANVDKADLSRWKTGKLPASSSMAQRIEKVLRGELPSKRPGGR
jgi:hypothetical protein